MRFLYIALFALLLYTPCFAATYYVDNAAANDAGSGAIGSPKKYIPSGIALMSLSGGDTLIVKDGTYAGSSNNITTLRSGTSGSYNTIRAENDGLAIVTASLQIDSGQYVRIEGFKFKIQETKHCYGTYIKFFRCAFEGGEVCSSGCDGAVNFSAGSYQLYEDCWFYGVGGRYTIMIQGEHDTVFRRCVVRHDGGYTADGSNPEAATVNYQANRIAWQNVVTINNNLTYSTAYQTSFYATGHAGNNTSNDVAYVGCIDVDGKGGSFYVDTDDGSTGMSITDSIFYDNDTVLANGNTGTAMTINRLTSGAQGGGIEVWSGSVNLANSVIWNHTGDGSGSKTVTYTNTYNPSSYTGTGVTHINPVTNGLLYLPRIEDASTLKTGGSSNGQRGAQIVCKIGTSGTLYGESGYNTVQSCPLGGTGGTSTDNLWPWPNESRIKTDFASVPSIGARGFATGNSRDDTPQTLTKYIWEYLGNTIPVEIYGGSGSGSGGRVGSGGASYRSGGGSFR